MAKIYILIALLPQLFCTLIRGQESPCPQYFKYMIKSDQTIGQIEIQSPPKIGQLHLKIILKLAAELPTKYIGRLELARSKEDSARNVLAGRNLLYYVYFPLRYPIPTLFGIWFNDEKYCSGPEATGHIITTITLEHTLYLPNMPSQISEPIRSHQNSRPTPKSDSTSTQATVTLSQGFGDNIFLNTIPKSPSQYSNTNLFLRPNLVQTVPQYSYNINNNNNNNNNNNHTNYNIFLKPIQTPQWPNPIKPVPQPSPTTQTHIDDNNNNNNNNNNNECGISSRSGNTNPLIANGQKTLPGQWPWLAALFIVRNGYEFLCGGSIMTNKHILTAGHCLKWNLTTNETIHPNVLEVALGRFNLHQFREVGTVNREVASYTIHPEFAHATTSDSDLAILTLRTPVEYNPFIKPICLWSGPIGLQNIVNKLGYVVGWGQDEIGHPWTENPRMAIMPIVSMENCHWSNPTYVSLTSNRTFCAGMRDGTGPCNGDSGSGLVIFDANTNRYQLRGVVSRSVRGSGPLCDLTQFTVFVDVAKYLSWIRLQISI